MEILPSSWKSCLTVFNLGLCERSELDEVLWTSLAILQLVSAQGGQPNPSLFAILFIAHLLAIFLGHFDDFENSIKTLKFKSKITHSTQDIFSLKAKLKIRPTQGHGSCSRLSDDEWQRWWSCVAAVSSWSQWISNFVFSRFPKSLAAAFEICSSISSGSRVQLKIRRTLVHAPQQRLSSRAGAHAWHSTTSTPTWPQRDPTFSTWQFTFRPGCIDLVSVSDFSSGGLDLENRPTLVHEALLGHSKAVSGSSWPSLSSSSTWTQWCSEFAHFCPIFHFSKSTSDAQQNISAHETVHKNRPTLVDAAQQGLSNASACYICRPTAAAPSWQY